MRTTATAALATPAVIYARISEADEGDELGVRRQIKMCKELAERLGVSIGEILIDNDVSAYSRKPRPAFEQLVGMLKTGDTSTVLVYHADRLYRRNTDLERLVEIVESTGTRIHTAAAGDVDLSTASGRMVARMLGAAAQHESERLGERMKLKNDELAASGQPHSRSPYGYAPCTIVVDGKEVRSLSIVDEQADIIRWIANRVLDGASLEGITRDLNARNVPTRDAKRPGRWHASGVRGSVLVPAVAGFRQLRGEIVGKGNWPAILDEPTWTRVRDVLSDPARLKSRPSAGYLLSGLVFASDGRRMTGRPQFKGHRRTYSTKEAPWISVDAGELEDLVRDMMLARLDDDALPAPSNATKDHRGEVAALEAELEELADARGKGDISFKEWMAARRPLQERLDLAKSAAGEAKKVTTTVRRLVAQPGAVRDRWEAEAFGFDQKREVFGFVIERVRISAAARGRWTTMEERIHPENGGGVDWLA